VNTKVASATVALTFTPADGKWACTTSAPAEVKPKACL